MKTSRALLFTAAFLLPVLAVAGSIFDLMYADNDRPLVIRLEAPMDSLYNNSDEEHQSVLSFKDVAGKQQVWHLKVGLRGGFRLRNCDFAPLKLNFKKGELKDAGLVKFDKYKLVTNCFDSEEAQSLVYREYLAYRTYNLISKHSFRVQLLTITYVDSEGKHPDREATGFIIEEEDELANRLGIDIFPGASGAPSMSYNARAEATHAMFQYLIGNGDYSTAIVHNLKVYGTPGSGLIPVGYDFDFSGWVGAPYALMETEEGLQNIFEPAYQGFALNDELMRGVADHFLDKEKAVVGLINAFTWLPNKEQKELKRFARQFFKDLKRMNGNTERSLYDQLKDGK